MLAHWEAEPIAILEAGRWKLEAKDRKSLINGLHDEQDGAAVWGEHALGDGVVEERQHPVVKAVDVEQNDRFGVEFEGLPRKHFEEFFECPEASGKDEEGVRAVAHQRFAGVHGRGYVKLGEPGVPNLQVDKDLRNDPDDASSMAERGVGDRLHEAGVGSAIDQAQPAQGEFPAECLCRGPVGGVSPVSGGAEDGYVANR